MLPFVSMPGWGCAVVLEVAWSFHYGLSKNQNAGMGRFFSRYWYKKLLCGTQGKQIKGNPAGIALAIATVFYQEAGRFLDFFPVAGTRRAVFFTHAP